MAQLYFPAIWRGIWLALRYVAIPLHVDRNLTKLTHEFEEHVMKERKEHEMMRKELQAAQTGSHREISKEISSLRSEMVQGFRSLQTQMTNVALAVRGHDGKNSNE